MPTSPEQSQNNNVFEPFIFRNGEKAYSAEELVKIAERVPQDGIYFLMEGDFQKWFEYIGRSDLAKIANSARLSSKNGKQCLRQFTQDYYFVSANSSKKDSTMSSQISRVIYVQDYNASKQSNLYELNIDTGATKLVGNIGKETYDLAFVGSDLYALDKKGQTMDLIKINPQSGETQVVGNVGYNVVGLAYNLQRQKLYATAYQNYQIIEIDTKTGKGKVAVTLRNRDRLVGEIAFDPQGNTYISLTGKDRKKYLATCNLDTGAIDLIGDTYFPGLASMEFVGGTLYGVGGKYEGLGGSNGQLIRIDTSTGVGNLVLMTKPALCWAGMAVLKSSTASVSTGSGAGGEDSSSVSQGSGSSSTTSSVSGSSSSSTTSSVSGSSSSSTTSSVSGSSSSSSTSSVSGSSSTTGSFAGAGSATGSVTGSSFTAGSFTGSGSTMNEEISFTFNFDESGIEEAWKAIAAKVESASTVTSVQDATAEARRWEQLENWLFTGYKAQAKELALQVARLELMVNTYKDQLSSNLQLAFRQWSTHFDGRLQSVIGNQIAEVTQGSLNVALQQLKVDILNQTSQLIQTEINNSRTEINKNIETQISNVKTEISNVKTEINQSFEAQISSVRTEISNVQTEINKSIETKISNVTTEINKSIDAKISNVTTEINKSIDTKISNVTNEINQNIDNKVTNIDVTNLVSNEVSESITSNIRQDIDARFLDLTNITSNIQKDIDARFSKIDTNISSNFQQDIDVKFSDIRTNLNLLEQNFDTKISNLRVDFRGEVISTILAQLNQLIEEKTKLEIAKIDFNTYITQIDVKANQYLQQLNQLEVNLISRINQGDASLYNWVLEQLITLKGCLTDRQVLVEQLAFFSNQLKAKLDNAPCMETSGFTPWTPLPGTPQALPNVNPPQLPSNS